MAFSTHAPPLAERGFRVVPLIPRTKRPRFANWLNVATSDPETVERWSRQYGHCGVGLVPASQLVVDIDDPVPFHEYLAEREVTLPPTWTVATARGEHRWFALPGETSLPNTKIPGADVKVRGLLVGPGSTHPTGVVYRVIDDRPLAPAPEWLLSDLAERAARRQAVPQQGAVGGAAGGRKSDSRRVIGRVHAARAGERNDIAFWAFCRAADERDESYVSGVRDACAAIGLDDDEIETVERSARRRTGWTK
ncbi:bifunctional DNA primase/polymerase [Rhodococcus sp. NPDC060086]|uniref:bifunctional DNA primase/polymerase n=1 Tax=Rhodococcus sp. NPDC060086 TaxID=3347055 RepID=UPI003653230C